MKQRRHRKPRVATLPVFREYLRHLKRRSRTDRTIETYSSALGLFEAWLTIDPMQVNPERLTEYQQHLASPENHLGKPLSSSALSTHTGVIRSFYQWAAKEKKVLKDPSLHLQYPKVRRRIHRDILTPKELRRLLDRCDLNSAQGVRDAVSLRLLALSGLRVTELVSLNLDDVDVKEREVVIRMGKGRKDRLTFMDMQTQRVLSRYLAHARPQLANPDEVALVVTDDGTRSDRTKVNHLVKRYSKQARLPKAIAPHSLRRTYCTLMLQAGCNLKAIAELVGHASLGTTARYAQVDIAELSRVYHQSHPRA